MKNDNAPLTGLPRIGTRKWIAWKLVQAAYRMYNAEYDEAIVVQDPNGNEIIRFDVVGDLYGCGVSSQSGSTDLPGGCRVKWLGGYTPRGDL